MAVEIAGMDPDKVLLLAGALEEGADRLRASRSRLEAALAPLGRPVPDELRAVAAWADEQAGDLRRRTAAIRDADRISLVLRLFGLGFGLGPVVPLPAARFPTEAEAEAAGRRVAEQYRRSFDDPDGLFALVVALRRDGTDPLFARAFVEAFGADNLVEVPRVIQALEFQGSFLGVGPRGAHYRLDIDWTDRHIDAQPLLATFSSVLATATRTGLDRNVERAIANDDDVVALSWLLSQGEFSTSFLLEAFRAGVVRRIPEEVRTRAAPFTTGNDEGFPLGRMQGEGLPLDPKLGILGALARNPEAARLAATMAFDPPVKVLDRVGLEAGVGNAGDLLLDHGVHSDRGEALGDMLAAAARHMHALGDRQGAGELTERVIHAVVLGRREIDRAVRGLSSVLAEFHVADLHASARRGTLDDPNYDGDRFVGHVEAGTLVLPLKHVQSLLVDVSADGVARRVLFDAVAAHQARVVVNHAGNDDLTWATELGALSQLLVNANDEKAIRDEGARRERQAAVLALLDGAIGLIPLSKPASLVVGETKRIVRGNLSAGTDVDWPNYEFKQRTIHALDALIVGGYFERGHLGPTDEVLREAVEVTRGRAEAMFFVDGHLLPYGEMTPAQRQAFDEWMSTSSRVRTAIGGARQEAHQAMDDREKDN